MSPLYKTIGILLLFILITIILIYGKVLLVPLAFAAILAMVLLPFTRWMERKMKRGVAVTLATLSFMLLFVGVVFILTWQIGNLASDAFKMEGKLEEIIGSIRNMIDSKLGITKEMQEKIVADNKKDGAITVSKGLMGTAGFLLTFIVDFLLVIVYLFLFLYYRTHLKEFILKIVKTGSEENAKKTIHEATLVGQQYLTGLSLMIVCLWILYGISFSIIGVKYALFFAVLCGLLEMIPFVGNLTGTSLTVLFSLSQGANTTTVIAILATYAVIQFVQSYLIEPLVVGAKVNINPMFTIFILVVGETVWGVPGLILAIPLLAILKIIFDRIDGLKPFGDLIGKVEQKKPKAAKAKA